VKKSDVMMFAGTWLKQNILKDETEEGMLTILF
jgi:hypothetical protein